MRTPIIILILLIFLIFLGGGLAYYFYVKKPSKGGDDGKGGGDGGDDGKGGGDDDFCEIENNFIKKGSVIRLKNTKIDLFLTGVRGNKNEDVQTTSDCQGFPSCTLWEVESVTDQVNEGDVIKLKSVRMPEYYLTGTVPFQTSVKTLPKQSVNCKKCQEWTFEVVHSKNSEKCRSGKINSYDLIRLKNVNNPNNPLCGGLAGNGKEVKLTIPSPNYICDIWELDILT